MGFDVAIGMLIGCTVEYISFFCGLKKKCQSLVQPTGYLCPFCRSALGSKEPIVFINVT